MQTFFGIHIDPGSVGGMTVVLILSVAMGGLIGLEREVHGHPAGLRTHILVCLGATLMTLVSANLGHGSNDRISAQIVSGIGFLGAGAIIRDGVSIRGLTTAASIWATAGVGIALGTSPFFGQLALIATVIILFTLWLLYKIEGVIDRKGHRPILLHITVHDSPRATADVLARVALHELAIQSIELEAGQQPHTRSIFLRVALPSKFQREQFMGDLAELPAVKDVHLD